MTTKIINGIEVFVLVISFLLAITLIVNNVFNYPLGTLWLFRFRVPGFFYLSDEVSQSIMRSIFYLIIFVQFIIPILYFKNLHKELLKTMLCLVWFFFAFGIQVWKFGWEINFIYDINYDWHFQLFDLADFHVMISVFSAVIFFLSLITIKELREIAKKEFSVN